MGLICRLFQPLSLYSPTMITADLTIAFATLAVFCLFFNWILQLLKKRTNGGSRLPPGPFPWPIIGNLHQLRLPAHRTLTDLAHKYGPIMFLRLGSVPTLVISSSETAKLFLKSHDLVFASRPPTTAGKYLFYNFKDVLTAPYGQYWRQMRKLCVTKLLTAKRIESFRHLREEETCMMIRSIWEEGQRGRIAVNVSNAIFTLTSNIVWRILAGKTVSDYALSANGEGIKDLISEISSVIGTFNLGDFIPFLDGLDIQGIKRRTKKASKIFDELADKIIDDHVDHPKESKGRENDKDFVYVLLEIMKQAPENDETDQIKITRENIKAIVLDLFSAATDTSAIVVEWALSELLRHPQAMKSLQQEIESVVGENGKVEESDLATMKYLRCVLKETLRLHPPGPLAVPHESVEEVTVDGYDIPKKAMLIVNLWAIGRDPSVWGDDALEFKPERFMQEDHIDLTGTGDFRMIPFGAGRRGCPGASMAIPTVELALAQLSHNFDWKFEGDPSQMDMTETCGATIARQVPLFAVPRLRLPLPNYLHLDIHS